MHCLFTRAYLFMTIINVHAGKLWVSHALHFIRTRMTLFSVDISHANIFLSFYFVFFISSTCSRASDFGLMKADRNGRITDFLEKPKGENLKSMVHSLSLTPKMNNYLMICSDNVAFLLHN